jgi:hypothetical protein
MKIKWSWGNIFFAAFMGLVCLALFIFTLGFFGVGIPKENRVCYIGDKFCSDAGSPKAAKATNQMFEQTMTAQAARSATQTAMPVITRYGDITIQRFYDPKTGQFTVICLKADQIIPCSIQDKETEPK